MLRSIRNSIAFRPSLPHPFLQRLCSRPLLSCLPNMYASKRRLDSKHEQWRTDSFRASHRSTYLSKHGAIPTCNSSLHPPSSSPAVHPARCSKLKRISPRSLISQHQLHFIQHRAFFSFRSPPSGGGGGKIARILYGLGLLGGVILAKVDLLLI